MQPSTSNSPQSQMVKEEEKKLKATITPPFSLEGDTESSTNNYRAPNFMQRIFSLLKNVHIGSDLTQYQVPPLFNIPKSSLQTDGESVYCTSVDMLSRCANGETEFDRFISVVGWSLSTIRPLIFGVVPYNSILGETHHVSRGSLNVLLEQVSHHPPVTALHATDEKENIETIWCLSPKAKFYGTHIGIEFQGTRKLKLHSKNETYIMNMPRLVIRLLPIPSIDWCGNITISCQETGIRAELCYGGNNSFFQWKSAHRTVKGKIFMPTPSKDMFEINGYWDRYVDIKDIITGKKTLIYDAKETLTGMKAPTLVDPEGLSSMETTLIWSEVSQAILKRSWDKAREAKTEVEEKQRELARKLKSNGANWIPKHFTVSYSKESGWDCSPIQRLVPPGPIVVPI